jgi:hypothetical protein
MADFTEDQRDILAWLREFAEKEIRPQGAHWDKLEETPWPIIKKAAEAEIYSLEFFAQMFADPMFGAACVETLFWADAGIALALTGTGLAASGIMANGTPEQMGEWLPKCFKDGDETVLAAFCVSEPDAGSDVSSLRTRAVYDKKTDEWVLNGTKTWITNGGIAGLHVVVATVDPKLGSRGQASFIVPRGTKGLSQGQKFHKHGIRASHTAEVVLDDVRIPGSCLLGGKERLDKKLAKARAGESTGGKQAAMATFEMSRPLVGAQALGVAQAAYEYALKYAKERKQFGKAIAEHQAIAFKLAEMKTRIHLARLGVMSSLWMAKNGMSFDEAEGSQAKWYAGETAVWVTQEALQILGGAGFVDDHPVAQWHRDAAIFRIYEGTEEIQKLIIARKITGLHIQ